MNWIRQIVQLVRMNEAGGCFRCLVTGGVINQIDQPYSCMTKDRRNLYKILQYTGKIKFLTKD